MAKLTRAQRIEIYEKRKPGQTISSLKHEYGIIHNWIKKYKENGYNVKKKRDRPSMKKPKIKLSKPLTVEEELEELMKKNQYLEAENEYLKN